MKKKLNEAQQKVADKYTQIANKLGYQPSRSECIEAGLSRDSIRSAFGNLQKLQDVIKLDLPLEAPRAMPKVLLLDIETAPIEAYTWDIWNVNIATNQILKDWSILAWAAKWLDSDEIMYEDLRSSKNKRDDKKLLRAIWRLLDEADVIITQNGKGFDVKRLNARFLINGFQPPSSYRHLDTKLINQKYFHFTSYSLAFMAKALDLPHQKLTHSLFPGMSLWDATLKNNQKAWQEMEDYNKQDVLCLEDLYKRVAPWEGDVNFSVFTGITTCKCGSRDFKQMAKPYTTNSQRFERFRCKKCGAELKGKGLLKRASIKVSGTR